MVIAACSAKTAVAGRSEATVNYGAKEDEMKTIILGVAVVLTTVFVASALAAGNSPVSSVYHTEGTKVQNTVGPTTKPSGALGAKTQKHASAPAPSASQAGGLPFTGLDLAFLSGAGVVLVGMGFTLRRVTRKRPAA